MLRVIFYEFVSEHFMLCKMMRYKLSEPFVGVGIICTYVLYFVSVGIMVS